MGISSLFTRHRPARRPWIPKMDQYTWPGEVPMIKLSFLRILPDYVRWLVSLVSSALDGERRLIWGSWSATSVRARQVLCCDLD